MVPASAYNESETENLWIIDRLSENFVLPLWVNRLQDWVGDIRWVFWFQSEQICCRILQKVPVWIFTVLALLLYPLTSVFFVNVQHLLHLNKTFWFKLNISTLNIHISHRESCFSRHPNVFSHKFLYSSVLTLPCTHSCLLSHSGKFESTPTGRCASSAMASANLQMTTLWPATVR